MLFRNIEVDRKDKIHSFSKSERLKSKIEIDSLFVEGSTFFVYPFKVIYSIRKISNEKANPARIVISIPKRNFKHAVSRNLLRRRSKEAYRLNKQELNSYLSENEITLDMMLIYTDQQALEYKRIEKGIKKMLAKLISKIE